MFKRLLSTPRSLLSAFVDSVSAINTYANAMLIRAVSEELSAKKSVAHLSEEELKIFEAELKSRREESIAQIKKAAMLPMLILFAGVFVFVFIGLAFSFVSWLIGVIL